MPHISGKEPPPMSINPSERTGTGRPDSWNDNNELVGPTGIPPEGERHEDYFPDSNANRRGLGWKKPAAVVALLGAGAAAALGITKGFGGGEVNPVPERSPAASATPNPGETEAPQEAEPTSFALSGPEAYATNPEQIAADFFDRWNYLYSSGYSADAVKDERYAQLTNEDYANILNEPFDTKFASEMFASDWTDNPNMTQWYDTTMQEHWTTTTMALKIAPVEDGGFTPSTEERYLRTMNPDTDTAEVISADESVISLRVSWNGGDNRDKNDVESVIGNGFDPNQESGSYILTFVNEGGQMKLSDISYE
jgi:hypothetical protein